MFFRFLPISLFAVTLGCVMGKGSSFSNYVWVPVPVPLSMIISSLWVGVVVLSMLTSVWVLAAVLSVPAAWGAMSTVSRFNSYRGFKADALTAAWVCSLAPLAAVLGFPTLGWYFLLGLGVLLVSGLLGVSKSSVFSVIVGVLPVWMLTSLSTAGFVSIVLTDVGLAFWFLAVTSAFDAGLYLMGVGASNVSEGYVSGILLSTAAAAALYVAGIPPFDLYDTVLYTLVAVVLCPLGVVFGSSALPTRQSVAPGVRRLDSWVFTAPVWLALFLAPVWPVV